MFDFQEKRKLRRFFYSKASIVLLFLVTLLIGRSVYERYTVERDMARKLEDRMEELDSLRARASLLGSKVEHLKNDRGIEEELRSRFDVAKEGEQVVVILDEVEGSAEVQTTPTATPSAERGEESFLDRLIFW